MDILLPFLEISGPEGQNIHVDLDKDAVTIGRFAQYNDIALSPDPQQLITRKVHCTLVRDASGWWVVDNGSVNRTFLRRDGEMQVVQGRAQLNEGESICILGKLTEDGKPLYWELTFKDPMGTRPASMPLQIAYLEYDWLQARLYRVEGPRRQEITELRPQEHKLIRYMEQRNRANGYVPVMCSYEELLSAVWGEDAQHTENDIAHLIWELRKKLEPDPKTPRFLETARGLGYRLITQPSSADEA